MTTIYFGAHIRVPIILRGDKFSLIMFIEKRLIEQLMIQFKNKKYRTAMTRGRSLLPRIDDGCCGMLKTVVGVNTFEN